MDSFFFSFLTTCLQNMLS